MEIPNPVKRVDEDWKQQIEKEKSSSPDLKAAKGQSTVEKKQSQAEDSGGVSFQVFVSNLAMQAYVALGDLEDPGSGLKSTQLPQAKYMIDLLTMLQRKTAANLTPDEERMLNGALYELRVRFVEKSGAVVS